MFTVYITPWYNCNLNCPHCDVHLRKYPDNFNKFLERLKILKRIKGAEDHFVLFGGEPLLYQDKFECIVDTGCIDSVSTNMLLWSDHVSKLFKKYNMSIATSYNPRRFTGDNYTTWLKNLSSARREGIDIVVLITLTEDLFKTPMRQTLQVMDDIRCSGVEKFLFEPYIGTVECNEQADEWLVKFHEAYKCFHKPMKSLILDKLDNWNCDCANVRTFEPDGNLRNGCPQYTPTPVPVQCLTCGLAEKCRPCALLKTCSFPQKLYKWVKGL